MAYFINLTQIATQIPLCSTQIVIECENHQNLQYLQPVLDQVV